MEPSGLARTTMLPNSSAVQQTALRANRVGELLPARHWLGADLAGGVHGVLIVERRYDIADGNAQTRQRVGPHPETHRVLARAEDCYLADPGTRLIGSLMLMYA